MPISRRLHTLLCLMVFALSAFAADEKPDSLAWFDPSRWGVEGRGWTDVKRYFDRLPAHAEGIVREQVWNLSRSSSGISAQFRTDAQEIQVRYSLFHPELAKPHMPATGVSGADLYVQTAGGSWRWIGTVLPENRVVRAPLVKHMAPGFRSYMIYFPLYNGVDSVAIGVPVGARFEPVTPRQDKPIVFYGTSIMQGACASRPGMAIPAIIGRRLNAPTINLGFSGNGRMEPELAGLLAEIDAAVYVLDCLPNLKPGEVRERADLFVSRLRAARPQTPILLVEDREFPNAFIIPDRAAGHEESHAGLRAVYEQLIREGFTGLFYLKGENLLGIDGEATVDGSHPTDLGMMRYADAYENVLRRVMRGE